MLQPPSIKFARFEDLGSTYVPPTFHSMDDWGPAGEPTRIREWIFEQNLGAGGCGVVFQARHETLGLRRAFKILKPYFAAQSEENIHAFLREAQAMVGFSHHPRIVTLHDCGSQDGIHFISMDLIEGYEVAPGHIARSVSQELSLALQSGQQGLSQERALRIGIDVLDALETAHAAGIIHRDIKPSNILLTADGRALLADFGISQIVEKEAQDLRDGRTSTTQRESKTARALSYSLGYASPEQLAGKKPLPSSDLYSLGIVLYELLTGERPEGEVDYPYEMGCPVAPWWDDFLRKSRKKVPTARWSSATDMKNALLAHEGMTGVPLVMADEHPASLVESSEENRDIPLVTEKPVPEPTPTNPPAPIPPNLPQYQPITPPAAAHTTASSRKTQKKSSAKLVIITLIAACAGIAILVGIIMSQKGKQSSNPPSPTISRSLPDSMAEESTQTTSPSKEIEIANLTKSEWESLAEDGNAYAQALLAGLYMIGAKDTPIDLSKAREWAEKSAKQNHPLGLYAMGVVEENNPLTPTLEQRENNAKPYYEKAIKNGFLEPPNQQSAQWINRIGRAHRLGTGVAKDEAKAVELYKKAADLDDAQAIAILGLCYQIGTGVTKNETKAVELYQKAVDLGDAMAMGNLGLCYQNGTGVAKDEAKAVGLYQKAADLGDYYAINSLGFCYQNGTGVTKNETKAVELFQKAADLGNAFAMSNLGYCYQSGMGVRKDLERAKELYEDSANLENAAGLTNLGSFYMKGEGGLSVNILKAVDLYKEAANLGESQAMANLGQIYLYGTKDIIKDEKKGLEWVRKAADLENPQAMVDIGISYENGLGGLSKSQEDAVKWYQKAADLGYARAMTNLGVFYQYGKGLAKNETKALEYYKKAADLGDARAICILGFFYEKGEGVEKDAQKAFELYQKSAALKDAVATFNLACCYRDGIGVQKSQNMAIKNYIQADELGDLNATYELGLMYAHGLYGQKENRIKAKSYFEKASDKGHAKATDMLKQFE